MVILSNFSYTIITIMVLLVLQNNKPLMEKRRRQRINDCLVQLKGLVLQAMNKDVSTVQIHYQMFVFNR